MGSSSLLSTSGTMPERRVGKELMQTSGAEYLLFEHLTLGRGRQQVARGKERKTGNC